MHRFIVVAPAGSDGRFTITVVCVRCDETKRNYPYMGEKADTIFADLNGRSFKAYYCEPCMNEVNHAE